MKGKTILEYPLARSGGGSRGYGFRSPIPVAFWVCFLLLVFRVSAFGSADGSISPERESIEPEFTAMEVEVRDSTVEETESRMGILRFIGEGVIRADLASEPPSRIYGIQDGQISLEPGTYTLIRIWTRIENEDGVRYEGESVLRRRIDIVAGEETVIQAGGPLRIDGISVSSYKTHVFANLTDIKGIGGEIYKYSRDFRVDRPRVEYRILSSEGIGLATETTTLEYG